MFVKLQSIALDDIVCDIVGRTNNNNLDLLESLIRFGQLEPIIVEGPDENKRYYLIHGYRRYVSFYEARSKLSSYISCLVLRDLTTEKERNKLRMIMLSEDKKATGLDQQLVWEQIPLEQRENIIPRRKQKRMIKGINVPQNIRIKYEKKHRSQDALDTIYNLDCPRYYKNLLLNKLLNGSITTVHGDAIKRVIRHKLYERLNDKQRINVINKALNVAKFTNNKAGFLIFTELMKCDPQKDNMVSWIEYFKGEIETVSDMLNDKMIPLLSEREKEKLRIIIRDFNSKLSFITDENNKTAVINLEDRIKQNSKTMPEYKQLTVKNSKGMKVNFVYQ